MLISVPNSSELATQMLTEGYTVHATTSITKGLPPGAKLIGVTFAGSPQMLVLVFEVPGEGLARDIAIEVRASNRASCFWVIERFEDGHSKGYWTGESSRSFTPSIDAAVQFRRRQDALPIKSSWHWKDCAIVEHKYADGPDPEGACPP
jgi:hypothetical protein